MIERRRRLFCLGIVGAVLWTIAAGVMCGVGTAAQTYWAYFNILSGRSVTAVRWSLRPDPNILALLNSQERQNASRPLEKGDLTPRLVEANGISWSFILTSLIPIVTALALGWSLCWAHSKGRQERNGKGTLAHHPENLRNMSPRCIRDLLSQDEVTAINNAPLIAGARHPTWYPIFRPTDRPAEVLTNQSVAIVANAAKNIDWLRALHPRLVRLDDHEEAAAALAELRAYGAFVEAGFAVTPIPRAATTTPDFTVDAGDGAVVVEVFTKNQDAAQKAFLAQIRAGNTPPGVGRSIFKGKRFSMTTTVATLQPGGAPDPAKPDDSTQANMISRVCAAKADETQLPNDRPSLVWIDFRNFGLWPEVLTLEQSAPLMSGHHGLTSGALWYAFYGWRGAPIFEEDVPLHERVVTMGHNGRFRLTGAKKTKLSGAILVLHDGLILLENPWAAHPLPGRARRFSERLPWFDLGRSICNWAPGDALALAESGRRQIEIMAEWRTTFEKD